MLAMGKNHGFTLIEVMIVVAIVGLLSAIALPSYTNYVRRARMQGAFTAMSEVRFRLEQFYQNNNNYGTSAASCPNAIGLPSPEQFTMSCAWRSDGPDASTNRSYLIMATGSGGMAGFTFTLNEQNLPQTTSFTGAANLPRNCWMTSSGGCQ